MRQLIKTTIKSNNGIWLEDFCSVRSQKNSGWQLNDCFERAQNSSIKTLNARKQLRTGEISVLIRSENFWKPIKAKYSLLEFELNQIYHRSVLRTLKTFHQL